MKKLIVPTDFSENATHAVNYAVNLAKASDSEIVILNVFTNVYTTFSGRRQLINEYNDTIATRIQEQLDLLKQSLILKLALVRVRTKLYNGEVIASILQCAEDEDADLIIMGTQGASGLKKIFIGSITAGIIGNTTAPVLAIPQQARWSSLANILFATREFEVNEKVFGPILNLAYLDSTQVHVVTFTDIDDAEALDYLEHERLLNNYTQKLPEKYKNIKFKTAHIEGQEFSDAIEDYSKYNKIDAIVMTTHKRSFWENLFNRSMTKEMACHIEIPLLAIPV